MEHKHIYDKQGKQICCTLEEKINKKIEKAKELGKIFELYQKEIKKRGLYDFSDMILYEIILRFNKIKILFYRNFFQVTNTIPTSPCVRSFKITTNKKTKFRMSSIYTID